MSWIRLLGATNPRLDTGLPVVFLQSSPDQGGELTVQDTSTTDDEMQRIQGDEEKTKGRNNENIDNSEDPKPR